MAEANTRAKIIIMAKVISGVKPAFVMRANWIRQYQLKEAPC
jgi:hypothetical protein